MSQDRLLVAIDTAELDGADRPAVRWRGPAAASSSGSSSSRPTGRRASPKIVAAGAKLFLDLKFHDIPNTVAGAVRAARAGPFTPTSTPSGGRAMMEAAAAAGGQGAAKARKPKPILLAVTVYHQPQRRRSLGGGPARPRPRTRSDAWWCWRRNPASRAVCSAPRLQACAPMCPDFKLVAGYRPTWSRRRIRSGSWGRRRDPAGRRLSRGRTAHHRRTRSARGRASIAQEIAKGFDKGAGA